ncbi:leucine--tRNA ligase [Ginsengibacter hankyongi]|uniref:Leucine--tRNA ligase n=1 Tax=Ginsengibacter hankyongi TaxID=2607284 RepID=A0A5J5ILZ8_9BACT|nr:class I tRNA ligase family protein [Ginsengibacter hankyongi]KAA9042166.1 leucine--tRNA ligase [Ginsengibacter hankyongi]
MEYNFREIEKNWQKAWKESGVYKVSNTSDNPKFYVLDMFPYPSGAGLHVGHPLGYIASDIYARYKRLKGFNVLHPMGYDSFGLPAEQYALETGQHPAVTTEKNIETFRQQLDNIGFCFDWSREVRTSDPKYYKWTQWIFLEIFNSWYDRKHNKARRIEDLIKIFEQQGNKEDNGQRQTQNYFSADEWNSFSGEHKQELLMDYRLAFSAFGEVNWCEALGTVLANDEVINGVSERGGHPVVKKKMRQWYLRITDYAERLLEGLETVEFSDAMKEMQRNWIGKSEGAEMDFAIADSQLTLKVYTTRPDTIFGVDFMVLAPEHELVNLITTEEQRSAIDEYLTYVKSRSDRERMAEVKQITGCFTGAYAINPFDGRKIPIWIAEYVLAGYGTGAIMAVPCGDQRDFDFATHFNIPITNIIGEYFNGQEANPTKEASLTNSGFLNGIKMKDAIDVVLNRIEEEGIGNRKVNYKMRDAGFSRQRYWGEPFPIVYRDGVAYPLEEKDLPVELPHVENYKPGPEGEGPLANIPEWVNLDNGERRETNTMPGYAGSSWYFLRYMDPHNDKEFANRKATDYWNQVDVYIGGTEHAVGHLLYSRMWTKVLYDLGFIGFDEPFKKLVNQGMIQGSSRFVYRILPSILVGIESVDKMENITPELPPIFLSKSIVDTLGGSTNDAGKLFLIISGILQEIARYKYPEWSLTTIFANHVPIHVDVNIVNGVELDIDAFRNWKPEYKESIFICENGIVNTTIPFGDWKEMLPVGNYICDVEIEKMSKSKYNTVNPNDLIDKYGADTFRMYEMFLGPVEASKPWDTKGIEGVHRFLKKLWRLFYDDIKGKVWNEEKATDAELKVLHKTIKKIEEDTERFSYNTAVSAFMVCVNELIDLKCHKKEILEPLLILLTPYAPHISEELYHSLNNKTTILDAAYPRLETKYLIESEKEYPVSINGKMRTTITISLDASQDEVEKIALNNEIVQKWLEGKQPKKIIFVKNKMINIVV